MRLPTARRSRLHRCFSEIEAASGERLARLGQTIEQRLAVRQHKAGDPAQDLDPAGRQMELTPPDIDPHNCRCRY